MVKENVQFLKNNRAEWILIQNLNGLQLTWIRNKLQKIQNLKKIVRRLARSISGTWLEKNRLTNYCERTKVKHFETVLNDIATKKQNFGGDFGYFFCFASHIFFFNAGLEDEHLLGAEARLLYKLLVPSKIKIFQKILMRFWKKIVEQWN